MLNDLENWLRDNDEKIGGAVIGAMLAILAIMIVIVFGGLLVLGLQTAPLVTSFVIGIIAAGGYVGWRS